MYPLHWGVKAGIKCQVEKSEAGCQMIAALKWRKYGKKWEKCFDPDREDPALQIQWPQQNLAHEVELIGQSEALAIWFLIY